MGEGVATRNYENVVKSETKPGNTTPLALLKKMIIVPASLAGDTAGRWFVIFSRNRQGL